MSTSRSIIICDLDDTLIKTDLLFESVLKLVRIKPLVAFALPFWFLRGKAYAKSRIAEQVTLDPATLPYREEVLQYLRSRRDAGSQVILASASHHLFVQPIADYCQCFDMAQGTSGSINLKSANKLNWIETNFGQSFEYIGDSAADLPIWRKATHAFLVNPNKRVLAAV